MKILLLNPPLFDQTNYGKKILLSPFPGTGLSYLYSYLKQNNYNCKIHDFFFDSWDYVESVLIKENADIIGITCLTEMRHNAFKLLSLIRKIKKNTIVIFGGHHSTYMSDQLLKTFEIDYIVLGEGEIRLLNLIRAIEGSIPLESVEGIAYKKNENIIKNLPKKDDEYIKNLDALPFPFSEEQMGMFKKYPLMKEIHPQLVMDIPPEVYENGRIVSIITSRGCPFNCQFCSSTLFWGKKWRFRSPKNIVDEIEFYYNQYGFRYFNFADDAFTIMPKRSINICEEIIERNLKIYFDCTTRADRITEDLAIWLKKAGCVFIAIGVESGSKKILKIINKNLSIKSIIRAFSILRKHKISAYPLLMVGNPGETNKTIQSTINLLKIIKPHTLAISKTMIFPGTQLYEVAKKQGFIDDNYWLTAKPPPYYTYENSLRTLRKWVDFIRHYKKNKYQLTISRFFLLYFTLIEKLPEKLRNVLKKLKIVMS